MTAIGDTVRWINGRKPLGVVITKFYHDNIAFVVVKKPNGTLEVARDYEKLVVVKGS